MTQNATPSVKVQNFIDRRPAFISFLSILFLISAAGITIGFLFFGLGSEAATEGDSLFTFSIGRILAAVILVGLSVYITTGLWQLKNWARTIVMFTSMLAILAYLVTVLFDVSSQIFEGNEAITLLQILLILLNTIWNIVLICGIPGLIVYGLMRFEQYFEETVEQREFVDKSIKYILVITAFSAIFIVFLIILFTLMESWDAIEQIGLDNMLIGTIWRPGMDEYGLIPMILGSIFATIGAAVIGIPLSLGAAILLAEVAPQIFREIVRPSVELLAGIPSVIYGLFGMVVLAPIIRMIEIPRNTGFGILSASIVLAVMIIPTITNIAEDAIRAVPKYYKEGSLALGTTRWETIFKVILPAARSGIIAAVILGIGRALGETMAVIMIIGNSIAIPSPISDNPLSIILSTARTLTGNIAVEINYATGEHRSALFFTGIILFLMIFLVNSIARFVMKERIKS